MKDISVELSYILRHRPEKIGLSLEPGGWVLVDDLLTKLKLKKDVLDLIVKNNDKQRFEYSKDNIKIRARQGHSVKVDLGYKAEIPPKQLFHGTCIAFSKSILKNGIDKGKRHHVHLTADETLAFKTGKRHGEPFIFIVESFEMYKDGIKFYKTDNNVWLTEHVPAKYLKTE